ncbi:MAG TPA: hypothetical protein VFC63_09870 [Blastocatellia bacterium]|nr:hypothetical protein [Blastocatellia bacterium]
MDKKQIPIARKDGFVVKKLDNETLVYDTERQTAHCLNHNAAVIWEHCDGSRNVDQLIDFFDVGINLSKSQKEQIVLIALNELSKSHLLESPIADLHVTKGVTSRELIKVAGIAALFAIPVVSTIVAPTAAQASTCLASGQSCTISAECCSGLCSAGTCA